MDTAKKAAALRQGINIMIALAVLTAVEFVFGLLNVWLALVLLLLVKAGLVIQYYMHFPHAFAADGEGGH